MKAFYKKESFMISVQIDQLGIASLQKVAQGHKHPRVRLKALTVLLNACGLAHTKIAEILNICVNTIIAYCKEFLQGGLKAITELRFRKPEGALAPFKKEIREYMEKTPPATIKQACAEIKDLTGVELKRTQMRAYLHSIGAKRRKVCGIPAKADVEKQKLFLENELQPRLNEAAAGKRSVKFIDAAHFVLGGHLGFLWSLRRVLVKTPSGRQRHNVLGAVDAITKEMITVTNDTYITSIQVCELLESIAQKKNLPTTVVLDNARYQRCKLVIDKAKELGIELLFLPPYSPNLNLIERVWKFLNKTCLHSKYYAVFAAFQQAINQFLDTMHQKYATELESLLTLKFQLFTGTEYAIAT
jgi:transposase